MHQTRRPGPRRAAPRLSSWKDSAACRDTADPDDWFPGGDDAARDRAIGVCLRCPVRPACLKAGLDGREAGIWGGLTEQQRDAMRRAAARSRSSAGAPATAPPRGPMDIARWLGSLRAAHPSTRAVAKAAGMGVERAAMYLDLLGLDDSTQARVQAGVISVATAVSAVRAARAENGRRAS